MCLIIKTDNPSQLHKGLLETAYENNSDGFGVMFCNNGKLHTHKIVPKTFKDIEKLWDKYKNVDSGMGIHFRFNTNGDTNRAMSHPFEVLSKAKGDDRDMWVMHNGPQLPTPMIDNNKSDTHQFVKWVLRPQLSANPKLLHNAEWQEMIEELIGTDKLLFLDGKTKEFVVYNEDQGKEIDNVGWLSNTYSVQPSSYGVRDKYYDFETNTMKDVAKDKYSWTYDDDDWGYTSYGGGYRRTSPQKFTGQASGKVIDYTADKGGQVDTKAVEDDSLMYNGKHLQWDDLCTRDREELVELCEENPVGVASYIHTNITGGN